MSNNRYLILFEFSFMQVFSFLKRVDILKIYII